MSNIRNKIRLPACSGTARAEARRQGRSPDPTRAFKPMAGETAAKHLYELGELNRLNYTKIKISRPRNPGQDYRDEIPFSSHYSIGMSLGDLSRAPDLARASDTYRQQSKIDSLYAPITTSRSRIRGGHGLVVSDSGELGKPAFDHVAVARRIDVPLIRR